MKKLLTVIATACFLVYPCVCFSSYVIHLKDGREFVTDRYYEEGDQIKFKRYGGVIGIEKDLVKEIEEKEDIPEEKAAPAKPETPPATEKADDAKKPEGPEATEKASEDVVVKEEGTGDKSDQEKATGKEERGTEEKKIDVARYKNEKTVLMEKFRQARQRLRDARKSRDKAGIKKAKKELKNAEKEISTLVLNLRKENGGLIPPWWFETESEEPVEAPKGH